MSRRVVPAFLLAGTVLGEAVLRASVFEPSPIEQPGRDRFTHVRGGCEVGPTGASEPDRYLDAGEIVLYDVSFRSMTNASNVTVALRAVRADADSPASCAPGGLDCTDPDRVNNPVATELSILGSPVVLASVPAGVPQTVSFTIHVADDVLGTPKTELLVDVTSGATHEILVARTSLDVDEQSVYYSTDFPLGGVQDRDLDGDGTIENPIVGGPFNGRYETVTWSDLTAGGTLNLGVNSPWNFDITDGGFVSGVSATTDRDQFTDVIAQWGEDTNFNGFDNRRCQNEPEIACQRDTFCQPGTHCQSFEQRDPPDTTLNRSWNIRGGCGHQTKAPGNCSILTTLGCYTNADCPQGTGTCLANPTGVGGAWHTGRIGGTTTPPCLFHGLSAGHCQSYETISGAGDLRWFELLLTPVVTKVHTGTDADGDPTHTAEIRNFAWNSSLDLADGHATFTWELDNRNDIVRGVCNTWTYSCSTNADCPPGPCINGFCGVGIGPLPPCSTHADCPATGTCTAVVSSALTGDDAVLGSITGPYGAVTGGDPAALGGYPMFAPIDAGGSSTNISREGRPGCFFEGPGVSSPPYLLAGPPDGTPFVTKNGPIRNMDITRLGGPDLAFELLEDRIGDTGTAFRGAFGFEVTQKALPGDPDPLPGFGAAVDDVVLEWREYTLVEDVAGCGPGEPTILAVGKDGEDVLIDYASGCSSASHNVEYGPLASVSTYGYSGHDCGIGDGGTHRFQPGPGSFFWIVVATDGDSIEGSYGRDSFGAERPEDTTDWECAFTQQLAERCDLDQDFDDDGVHNSTDNCPSVANAGQQNADGDATGDVCDTCTDTDADGAGNPGFPANTCPADNCPTIANPTQQNSDGDGVGDVCGVPPLLNDYCEPTFCSDPANDGHVFKRDGVPPTYGSGTTPLITGDDRIQGAQAGYRGILSFDTQALPDSAQLISATLWVTSSAVTGTVGTGAFQTISVAIAEGTYGNLGVEPSDYDVVPALSRLLGNPLPFPGTQSLVLLGSEKNWVNLVGRTEFRMQFNGEWDGDTTADQVQWYAGEQDPQQCAQSGEGGAPRLVIRYTAP